MNIYIYFREYGNIVDQWNARFKPGNLYGNSDLILSHTGWFLIAKYAILKNSTGNC